MIRKIIRIDEEKCSGCGLCAKACHEGAIEMIGGKAKLVRENFCDGLGDCLPACPAGAISFEEREAPEYDAEAVKAKRAAGGGTEGRVPSAGGCPGLRAMRIEHTPGICDSDGQEIPASCLAQWPCQLKLVPVKAPYFNGADLLIAADCTAYAYANIHRDFMRSRTTVIGCPKLDSVDYTEKLTAIIRNNNILGVTVLRMDVPCCGALQRAAENAVLGSGRDIPARIITISRDGRILNKKEE